MSKIKELSEKANRKVEMRWKVFSFDPAKDNELVDTSKQFDCICAAQAHKRELAEKHPDYIIEIVAESAAQEIAQEIKDEVKADIKTDLAAQINQELGNEIVTEPEGTFDITPETYDLGAEVKDEIEAEEDELAMEEDIDDDSDSIFGDELDEVEPESEDLFLEDAIKPEKHKLIVKHDGKVDEYVYDTKAFADKYAAEYKAKGYDVEVVKESAYNLHDEMVDDANARFDLAKPENRKKFIAKYKALGVSNKEIQEFLEYFDFNESAQKNEFNANSEKTLISKKQEIQKFAAKLTNDNLVQQLSLLKKYVDDAYNYALKHFDESAQINESRNWKVAVELSAPDNMNNAYVEDTVEHFLDKAGLTVFDVTATRK